MARFLLFEELMVAARAEDNLAKRRKRCRLRLEFPPVHADEDFMQHYRLTPALFEELLSDVVPLLGLPQRRDAISPDRKLLTALAFYASGSYQRGVGQSIDSSMAQQTVSLCIRKVTEALNHPNIVHKYIKFPLNRAERENVKHGYFDKFKIPGVIGSIDGTHVAIIRPTHHEERYFNRKMYHSLNVQVVCDSDLQIMSVDASHGGCTHDSFIFNNHELRAHLEHLTATGESTWLLGDAGYALREYMMTPVENPAEGSPEARYNQGQMSARNTIERVFGVLKARWRCLLAARALNYDPAIAGKIVNACCVLHNLCNSARVRPAVPPLTPAEMEEEAARQIHVVAPAPAGPGRARADPVRRGREARNRLIQNIERLRLN